MLQARNEVLKIALKYLYCLMPLAACTPVVNGGGKLTFHAGQHELLSFSGSSL